MAYQDETRGGGYPTDGGAKLGSELVAVPGGTVIKARKSHACLMPIAAQFDYDDVFVCDGCKTRYVVDDGGACGRFWKLVGK